MELMILNVYKMLCAYERTDTYLSLFGQAFLLTCYIWVLWYSNLSHIFLTDTRIPLKEREYLWEIELKSYKGIPKNIFESIYKTICIFLIWLTYIVFIVIFVMIGIMVSTLMTITLKVERIPYTIRDVRNAIYNQYDTSVKCCRDVLDMKSK